MITTSIDLLAHWSPNPCLYAQLGQYLGELTRIAEEFNVAVFLVNQCQGDLSPLCRMAEYGPARLLTLCRAGGSCV